MNAKSNLSPKIENRLKKIEEKTETQSSPNLISKIWNFFFWNCRESIRAKLVDFSEFIKDKQFDRPVIDLIFRIYKISVINFLVINFYENLKLKLDLENFLT